MMQRAALAVAEGAGEFEDARLARRQELLAGELRRGAQVERLPLAAGPDQLGGEGMQMGLVAGGDLQDRGFHFDEVPSAKPSPHGRRDAVAAQQQRPSVGMDIRPPKARILAHIYLVRPTCRKDWHLRPR